MEFRLQKKEKSAQLIMIGVIVVVLSLLVIGCDSLSSEPAVKDVVHDELLASNLEIVPVQEIKNDVADKVFILTGQNFKFVMDGVENPELNVRLGDQVRIEFTATEGFHDWKIDEFNAATQKIKVGSSTFVEFRADKAGTFEYYCSVASHRQQGMKGRLVVE